MTPHEGIVIYRKNGRKRGDVDFLCRTTVDIRVKDLFLPGLRISDPERIIPASTDLYFEVLCMNCEDIKGFSIVDRCALFYGSIFCAKKREKLRVVGLPDDVDLDNPSKVVFFVYNGCDFNIVSSQFKSSAFTAICVHFPLLMCVSWVEYVRAKHISAMAKIAFELFRKHNIPIPDEFASMQRELESESVSNSASVDYSV